MSGLDDYTALLRTRGIPLFEQGVHEVALDRHDVIKAIDILRRDSIPILGGDVWFVTDVGPTNGNWNWFSEPMPNESGAAYAERSAIESLNFIRNLPPTDREQIFVLVLENHHQVVRAALN